MEFKIISKESNKLLNKDVVKAEMLFEGATPSRVEIKKEFAKKNKFNPQLVVLKKIMNVFGERKLKLIIEIYKDEKALKNASKIYAKRDSKSVKEEKASEPSSDEESKEGENKEAKPEENKEEAEEETKEAENKEEAKEEPQKENNGNKESAEEDKKVEESKDNKGASE